MTLPPAKGLENLRWFIVLLSQITIAVLGTVLSKAIGAVVTTEFKIEVWNECIVVHQLAYFGFYASLLTALDIDDPYRDLIVFFMFLTFVFFAVGLLVSKTRSGGKTSGQQRIIGINVTFASISFVLTAILIFFLQSVKKAAP